MQHDLSGCDFPLIRKDAGFGFLLPKQGFPTSKFFKHLPDNHQAVTPLVRLP